MINHDWKIEDLPKLPEPWYWERGDIDGDPSAVRRQGGWICCVHEGNACRYSDEITITTRHDPEFEGELAFASAGSGCIPFPVFEAVHKALKIFYAKDDENMEKSIQHERERGDKWKRAYELANKQCEELESLVVEIEKECLAIIGHRETFKLDETGHLAVSEVGRHCHYRGEKFAAARIRSVIQKARAS
jgi:hypothetical protein